LAGTLPWIVTVLTISGFYPYTWWAQLAPSEKWGGVLVRLQIKPSPYFHRANYTLDKTSPYFSIYTLNKVPLYI